MNNIAFGQHIVMTGYKNGKPVTTKTQTIESIEITSQKQLWDIILGQLQKDDDCTEFKIYRDKHTRDIYRIEVSNESKT